VELHITREKPPGLLGLITSSPETSPSMGAMIIALERGGLTVRVLINNFSHEINKSYHGSFSISSTPFWITDKVDHSSMKREKESNEDRGHIMKKMFEDFKETVLGFSISQLHYTSLCLADDSRTLGLWSFASMEDRTSKFGTSSSSFFMEVRPLF